MPSAVAARAKKAAEINDNVSLGFMFASFMSEAFITHPQRIIRKQLRELGDLGVLRGVERRVGNEDPYVSVTDFRQFLPFRACIYFIRPICKFVNSELPVGGVTHRQPSSDFQLSMLH
jgi:hypothetical protein